MSDVRWPVWPPTNLRIRNAAALALLFSNWSISGNAGHGARPERRLANVYASFIGRGHCIPTSSGSSAIVIALQALGVKPGDAVIVPATTWVGCATAVLRVGAIPVFHDTDPMTLLARPIRSAYRPAAILVVHTYASRADVAQWRETFPSIPIIEDCSHCHAGWLKVGERLGAQGDVAVFSFQASKLLTSGEGGCVVTDREDLAYRIAALRADSRIHSDTTTTLVPSNLVHGSNHAMPELNAALLLAMLPQLDEINRRRATGVQRFVREIEETPFSVIADARALADGAFYGLPLSIPREMDMEVVLSAIADATGLRVDRCYPPIPKSPLYLPASLPAYASHGGQETNCAAAEEVWQSTLVLPHWCFLAPDSAVTGIVDALKAVARVTRRATYRVVRSVRGVPPPVTVAILTRDRPALLRHALAGIARQKYAGEIHVRILVDGAGRKPTIPATLQNLALIEVPDAVLDPGSPIMRVAHLRNIAVQLARTPLMAFLDDDNDWTSDHLSSLWEVMDMRDVPAVHSWRTLVDKDGAPYVPETFPWATCPTEAAARYEAAVGAGLFVPGSPVVRDAVEKRWKGHDVGMVDMGEWLFQRELLDALRFEQQFTAKELAGRIGEDDKLLSVLKDLDVPLAATMQPTLVYRMGGFSNSPSPLTLCES